MSIDDDAPAPTEPGVHEDAEAAASAESVQEIYAALAPQALDSDVAAETRPVLDDDALARHRVHVVLVAHDGQRWLPRTLQALARAEGLLADVVAVDTGSSDATAQMLNDSHAVSSVVELPRGTGFPAAVAAGYDRLGVDVGGGSDSTDGEHTWLWLLHDDCAPEPSCLRELLTSAVAHDAVVVGPKVLDWAGRRRLVEMGLSITGSGRRYTGLEGREYDQGQHDDRLDVLGVGTAGMLVRRDAWDALGGLDPQIDLFRDDVDFGWRARRAGYRVVVSPHAVVEHAAAATTGRRRPDASGKRAAVTDRRNAVHVLLANAGTLTFVPVLLRALIGTVLRAIGFVLGKVPAVASDEIVAVAGALRPSRIRAARRWRAAVPHSESIVGLRPTIGTQLRHTIENAGGVLGGRGAAHDAAAGFRRASSIDPLADDDFDDLPEPEGWASRAMGWTGLWLVLAVSVVVVVGARTVLFGGDLFGGALLPAPEGGADWWSTYRAGWHPVSLGSPQAAPPYLAALAAASAAVFGNASFLVSVLLIGAVPAAVATSWWAMSGVVGSAVLRVWASLTYGAVLLASGAVAAGRLGTCVVAVMAPLVARGVVSALAADAPLRRSWLAGLGLGVIAAFAPLVWPVAALAAAVGVLALARSGRSLLRWLIVVAVPAVVLLPWLPTLAQRSALWVSEPGLTGQGGQLSDPALPSWAPLLIHPGGPGSIAPGVLAGLTVLALAALVLAPGRRVTAAWVLAATAIAAGVIASRTLVSVPVGEGSAAGWPGPAVTLAALGIIAAIVLAVDRVDGAADRVDGAASRIVRLLAAGIGGATTVVALALGLVGSLADPLVRDDSALLPLYVTEEASGPERPTTLVLRLTGDDDPVVGNTVVREDTPRLGDAEVTDPVGAAVMDPIVADLVAGRGEASAARLADVGVRYVFAPPPLDAGLDEALDGQAGLVRASAPDGGSVWRVEGVTGRVRLLDEDAGAVGVVPSGRIDVDADIDAPAASVVALAEVADPGWQATLDDEPLEATTHSGDLQAFVLPVGSGRLQITYEHPNRSTLLTTQAVLLAVVVVLMLPAASRRRDSLVGDEV